jgi:hypothetical protein
MHVLASGFRETLTTNIQQVYTPTISQKWTGVSTCRHQSLRGFTRMITMPSQSVCTITLKVLRDNDREP